MSDEPIYTGWLPMQLSGDTKHAKTYEREGRRLLGSMLAINGVNDRLARGEPGGFYKATRTMPDGTQMMAVTNNGQHLVRIATPPRPTFGTIEPRVESASGNASGPAVHLNAEGGFEPAPLPHPTFSTPKHLDPEEERKKEESEYMWVGIRSTVPDIPWYGINAIMIEPDTGPLFEDSGLPKRGILGSINFWSGKWMTVSFEGETATIDPDSDVGQAATVDEAVGSTYDIWYSGSGAESNIIKGTHCIELVEEIDGGFFSYAMLFSASGLRCQANAAVDQGQPDPERWQPFDPLADDQSGAGVRNYGDRSLPSPSSNRIVPERLWDVVYWLDPFEDAQETPCETRPYVLETRRKLEEVGMRNETLPGDYILALHCFDDAPDLQSNRMGEEIPMYPGTNRSGGSDYIEYMEPVGLRNIGVEVEVRLGKGATSYTYTFETVIPNSDDRTNVNMPYGYLDYNDCARADGPNPFGTNFAPQLIAINPMAGTAGWVDLSEEQLPILGGGTYKLPNDERRPLDVYVFIHPVSQPDQDDYAEWAASAINAVLEAATAGVYGSMLMKEPSGLEGTFAGASKSMIWKYEAATGAITPHAVISEMDDYNYADWTDETGATHPSPYDPIMYWYYPYKQISKAACRNSLGIALTAVKEVWYFENGQVVHYDDPPPPDCC